MGTGWYQLGVRALDGSTVLEFEVVNPVGVGEVFVIAGQSNSANFVDPVQVPNDDRVNAVDLDNLVWVPALDPQPNADGRGGSPWPEFGDLLAAQADVPVGTLSVGVCGTSVDQ